MKTRIIIRDFFRFILARTQLALVPDRQLGCRAQASDTQVIISLTSIPSRLESLHLTIKSLLNQNLEFQKIILWLHEDLGGQIPGSLARYEGGRFEIGYCQTTEPHRKLVETLKRHPDQVIVTCDDDVIYPEDWLQRLITCWEATPGDIVAHMCRQIRFENGELMRYRSWRGEQRGASTPGTLALGWGGVVFPPGSLDERVLDYDTYMRLCPRADDLWFKAMAHLKGTAVRKSDAPNPEPVPILGSQVVSLQRENIGEDKNRVQMQALIEEYDLVFDEALLSERG